MGPRKLELRFRNTLYRLKGLLLSFYLKINGCKVGKRLVCKTFPVFRLPPCGNFKLGDNVNVGFRVTFDVRPNGRLVLGDNVNLTQDIIIGSHSSVTIGDYTQVAEFVSIRDSDHKMREDQLIVFQGHESAEIKAGRDVWIGAGVRVLKGAIIPDGAVIGANSLVTGKSKLEPYGIHAGVPVRLLRKRDK